MRLSGRGTHCLAWALALLLVAAPALAQRVEGDRAEGSGVYEAEVPVRSQSEDERQAGFARALAQVFAKRSGDRSVASRPGVATELRRAAEHVEGFDYRQDESIGASGAPSFRTMLVVRFVPEAIDALTTALGLPVWPQPRPKPVVWLAIDDGNGPRLVGLQHNNVARPLLQRAVERGYRLGLPTGSAAEMRGVSEQARLLTPEELDRHEDALMGTVEHSVLGRRWVYDAPADPVYVTEVCRVISQRDTAADHLQMEDGTVTPPPVNIRGGGEFGDRDPGMWNQERGYSSGPAAASVDSESWSVPGPHTGRGPEGYVRAESAIREDVCERLTRHGRLDASRVQVRVENGEVTLDGQVESRAAKRMAEETAESVSGVRDVHNRLRIDRADH